MDLVEVVIDSLIQLFRRGVGVSLATQMAKSNLVGGKHLPVHTSQGILIPPSG